MSSRQSEVVRRSISKQADPLEKEGVIAACKLFPGHGNVYGDTHIETVVNNSTVEFLTENDFAPFKKALKFA